MKIFYFNVNNVAMVIIHVGGYEIRATNLVIEIRNYNQGHPFKWFVTTPSTPAFRNAMNTVNKLRSEGEIK